MSSVNPAELPHELLSVAIVGNDALIQALPARPIQFAHACHAAGFDLVLPESWGDELVADTILTKLEERHGEPVVFCACPVVRERLLATGSELAPMLIATVAPSVAAARYARALYGARLRHLAYIGDCPAASGAEYDVHLRTSVFLEELRARGIDPVAQPVVFDAVLPPDRRRFLSLPGGCPSQEALWARGHQRALMTVDGVDEDLAIELAQQLLAHHPALLDVATALGCACSGVTSQTSGPGARVAVMSLEPPRAIAPVVDSGVVESLSVPVPNAFLTASMPAHARGGTAGAGASTIAPVAIAGLASTAPDASVAGERGSAELASGVAARVREERPPIAITPSHALGTVPDSRRDPEAR